jgi:hypothetical protein
MVRSLDLPLVDTIGVTRRERESYLHTIRANKAKPKQLILSKTYPTKLVINT